MENSNTKKPEIEGTEITALSDDLTVTVTDCAERKDPGPPPRFSYTFSFTITLPEGFPAPDVDRHTTSFKLDSATHPEFALYVGYDHDLPTSDPGTGSVSYSFIYDSKNYNEFSDSPLSKGYVFLEGTPDAAGKKPKAKGSAAISRGSLK